MKTLRFSQDHHLNKLHDELLKAFPEWVSTSVSGDRVAQHTVASKGNDIWLTVPDNTDEKAIAAVLAKHDSSPPVAALSANAQLETDLEKADSVAAIKVALLKWLKKV